ncbi:MAG: DNA primase noncatalytic subunit PriX [Candidatus Micrarchaeaceae archaeon]
MEDIYELAKKLDEKSLYFSYKYPFFDEAKEIAKLEKEFSVELAKEGKARLEQDLNKGPLFYKTSLREIMLAGVLSYPYARLFVSALNNFFAIDKFAESEAMRSEKAFNEEKEEDKKAIFEKMGIKVDKEDSFWKIPLLEYIKIKERPERLRICNMQLDRGTVYLSNKDLEDVVKSAFKSIIKKGLPISSDMIPKEIKEMAKDVVVLKHERETVKTQKGYEWINTILNTPIPDFRHRVVNLILAPYLVNILGFEVKDAKNVIVDYIERCKKINPNTKINEKYIEYQCAYAKKKGLKPLSLKRAKELIGEFVNLD